MTITADDIRRAASVLEQHIIRTPTLPAPALSRRLGCDLFVKLECLQHTSSFKARGAFLAMQHLDERQKQRGVIAMSAGNHAQAVAYHADRMGIPATIVMPAQTPFAKVARTRAFGAKVVLHGRNLNECEETVAKLIAADGLTLIHPYDDELVMTGQGTAGLEMLQDVPDLDILVVPIGGGGLIGGMATTIGTSTNLLVVSIAEDLGMDHIRVFDFTPIVAIAALIALPYLWLVMPRLLPDNGTANLRQRRAFAATLRFDDNSELIGMTPRDLEERLPDGFRFEGPLDRQITANSRLPVSGSHHALEEAMRVFKARVAPAWVIERLNAAAHSQQADVVVVEMAITAESRLVGLTIPSSGVAGQFGVAVLGIHQQERGPDKGRHEYSELQLKAGDVLLVMGPMAEIEEFAETDRLLLLEGVKEVPRRSKAVLAGAIMIGSVATASFGLWPIAIAALGGAIAMFVTGCVKFDRVGRALSANVIVLVAASIAVGRLILESGAAEWLGAIMAAGLQFLPPAAVLAAIMLFVTLLTNFASNAAAATVGTPIAFNIANTLGIPPEPMILAVLFGCNLCYATPIAYQTNMLIMEEGGYNFRDYIRTGVPLVMLMATTLSVLLVMFYM